MLEKIYEVYCQGKKEYDEDCSTFSKLNRITNSSENKIINDKNKYENKNKIVLGDNYQYYLECLSKDMKMDLVYMDPPFFSMADYSSVVTTNKINNEDKIESIKIASYKDSWAKNDGSYEYFRGIVKILLLAKNILSENGVVWIHLDWHAVHYVKVLADKIFGTDCFLNEIIWNYKSGGAGGNQFSRKHDTLLVYSKNKGRKLNIPKERSYNRGNKPYRFEGVKEYEDENGDWYTLVNMKDVWQIDMVGRTSKERNGYATQKPQELLRRVIESSSDEGTLCADFYGGSGAFAMACCDSNRNFISCDKNPLSARLLEKYMFQNDIDFEFIDLINTKKVGYLTYPIKIKVTRDDEIARINNYELDTSKMNFKKAEREKVENILKENPLSFISYYEISEISTEEKNVANIIVTPNKNSRIALEFVLKKGTQYKIRVIDIFGNEAVSFI